MITSWLLFCFCNIVMCKTNAISCLALIIQRDWLHTLYKKYARWSSRALDLSVKAILPVKWASYLVGLIIFISSKRPLSPICAYKTLQSMQKRLVLCITETARVVCSRVCARLYIYDRWWLHFERGSECSIGIELQNAHDQQRTWCTNAGTRDPYFHQRSNSHPRSLRRNVRSFYHAISVFREVNL